MRNSTIKIDYYQLPAEQTPAVTMPDLFIDYAENAKMYTEFKSEMLEIFTTYFHSENFKGRDNTELSYLIFGELNTMVDNLYLAQIECKKIVLGNEIKDFTATLPDKVKEITELERRLKELRGTDAVV